MLKNALNCITMYAGYAKIVYVFDIKIFFYQTCAGAYVSMTVNNQPQEDKGQTKEDQGDDGGQ